VIHALDARHVLARTPPAMMVVNTADLDPALLRDMLAKAPPMPLLPEPAPPDVAAAVAAEREACAQIMAEMRAKSRNHLFRSALTCAEGAIRARGAA
jgi:hypothetical protein